MDRLTNPYRPSAGAPPPALVGREAIIEEFEHALGRASRGMLDKSILAVGLRGVGKTVLLNRFAEIAQQRAVDVLFIEAPERQPFEVQVATQLRRVLLSYESLGSKAARSALSVLKSFTITLPDGVAIGIGVDAASGYADSGLLSEDLSDLMEAVGIAARDRRRTVLVCIDEMQYLEERRLSAIITAVHRTTRLGLPVMVVGAGLPQLRRAAGEAKSYAERLFRFETIGTLDPQDAALALRRPALSLGVEFANAAIKRIVELTEGYPFFLQEWGSHAWNAAPKSPITRSVVDSITPRVLSDLDESFFGVRLDRLTRAEVLYMAELAGLGKGSHRSGEIAARLQKTVGQVAPTRDGLIHKGMIYSPSYGETAFTVPLFDEFLRRHASNALSEASPTPRRRGHLEG